MQCGPKSILRFRLSRRRAYDLGAGSSRPRRLRSIVRRLICIRPIAIIDVPALECLIDVGAAGPAAGWRVPKRKFLESREEKRRAKTTWRLPIEARQLGRRVQCGLSECSRAAEKEAREEKNARLVVPAFFFLRASFPRTTKPVYAIAVA